MCSSDLLNLRPVQHFCIVIKPETVLCLRVNRNFVSTHVFPFYALCVIFILPWRLIDFLSINRISLLKISADGSPPRPFYREVTIIWISS